MKKNWWKILSVLLLLYTIIGGLLFEVPRVMILNETIRNLYFHVCMWFSMMILFTVSVVNAVKYLNKPGLPDWNWRKKASMKTLRIAD